MIHALHALRSIPGAFGCAAAGCGFMGSLGDAIAHAVRNQFTMRPDRDDRMARR